jgi:hypothetical protein
MKIKNYGFIVIGPGLLPENNKTVMEVPTFKMTAIGVSTFTEACLAAKILINEGIEVLELCGGFSKEQSEALSKHISGIIPIGHVCFTEQEQRKLDNFLRTSN